MADVVLINPTIMPPYMERFDIHPYRDWARNVPLGLLYITAYLVSQGYTVKVIDLIYNRIKKKEFISLLEYEQPKIVGMTVYTEAIHSALEFCSAVKGWSKEVVTVLGGPHVTFLDEETLQDEAVDIVVRGEGELTMAELADYFIRGHGSLSEIQGITYKIYDAEGPTTGGVKVIRNANRPLIQDLDQLLFPLRTALNIEDYPHPQIITARGCPSRCVFCAAGAISGGRYRARSADNVIQEIKEIRDTFDVKSLIFVDDTFTALPERTKAICHSLMKSNWNLMWVCESRVDVVTKELLKLMAESGCMGIQFGVESGVQNVLNSIGKHITIEQVEAAVRWASEAEMKLITCSFIIGHHTDTHDTIQQTLEFANSLSEKYGVFPAFSMNTPFPGTRLYNDREKLGIKIHSRDWSTHQLIYSKISTKYLTREDIQRWYFRANEMFGTEQKRLVAYLERGRKQQATRNTQENHL